MKLKVPISNPYPKAPLSKFSLKAADRKKLIKTKSTEREREVFGKTNFPDLNTCKNRRIRASEIPVKTSRDLLKERDKIPPGMKKTGKRMAVTNKIQKEILESLDAF